MPTLTRKPSAQRQPTGLRLIDDLIGADAEQATPAERQPTTIRPATNYETYVQPAILALRKLVRPVVQSMQDDPLGGLSPSALSGPLATMINLPRGTVLKHGGPRALDVVDPARLNPKSYYGRALYTSEVDDVPQHFADVARKTHGTGAVTEFRTARDMPIWDATNVTQGDIDRFAPHLTKAEIEAARRDPEYLRGLVQGRAFHEPDILDRVGVAGVRFPYQGSTALAVTPEGLHRGFVTNEAGERVTEEGRRRYADMMAGLRSASGGR